MTQRQGVESRLMEEIAFSFYSAHVPVEEVISQ
jgi:hypothetical protein